MNLYTYGDSCKVDFEIQWYQDVSVWIDYVKVMDEPAYNLFNPNDFYRDRIKGQLHRLLNHGNGSRVKGYYTEEIEYSMLACLEFIQDSIILQTANPSVKKIFVILYSKNKA
jgi:hypothetical protein